MHELGMDTTNLNPNFGTPLNPYNPNYFTGGSSGGSAYAVAAGLMPFTLGHDGGGSVRIPSGYCGLFGLKTSHGRVSYRPSSNLAKSTAVPGPLAANMIDLELAYRVMAQPDPDECDSSLFVQPGAALHSSGGHQRRTIGIYQTWFDRADDNVKKACLRVVEYLKNKLGYKVVDISLPLVHVSRIFLLFLLSGITNIFDSQEGQMAHAMTIMAEGERSPSNTSARIPAHHRSRLRRSQHQRYHSPKQSPTPSRQTTPRRRHPPSPKTTSNPHATPLPPLHSAPRHANPHTHHTQRRLANPPWRPKVRLLERKPADPQYGVCLAGEFHGMSGD